MGRGPTRYNFCCSYGKIQHGVGEGTIPFSTTRPLAGAWYQAAVEAAQEAGLWVGEFEWESSDAPLRQRTR